MKRASNTNVREPKDHTRLEPKKSEDVENIVADEPESPTEKSIRIVEPSSTIFMKIILCGDGMVGKTSLRFRYMGKNFPGEYIMSIGADFAVYQTKIGDKNIKLQIWDLAGQQQFGLVRSEYYKGAEGAMIVCAINNTESFKSMANWVTEVWKHNGKGPIPVVIVANKNDLRNTKENVICLPENLISDFAKGLSKQTLRDYGFGVPFVATSAKTGENVQEALNKLAEQILFFWKYFQNK